MMFLVLSIYRLCDSHTHSCFYNFVMMNVYLFFDCFSLHSGRNGTGRYGKQRSSVSNIDHRIGTAHMSSLEFDG